MGAEQSTLIMKADFEFTSDDVLGEQPAMLKDELPDDLVEFLESDRRLEYDVSACEIGVFTFRSLEEVVEIDLAVRVEGQETTATSTRWTS